MSCDKQRGCGHRAAGGLYMCCGMGPDGRPIEHFLLDPTWTTDLGPQRAPQLLERPCPACVGSGRSLTAGATCHEGKTTYTGPPCPSCTGTGQRLDVLVYVGEEGYPCVPDFVEEARGMGVSRRIPKNFPVEKLSPNPVMYLYHRRGTYRRPRTGWFPACPRQTAHKELVDPCIFQLWPWASLLPDGVEVEDGERVERQVGSLTYRVPNWRQSQPSQEDFAYTTAIFAAFPITSLQWIQPKGKAMDPELEERAQAWTVRLEAIPEDQADEPIRV